MDKTYHAKLDILKDILSKMKHVLVAFSGGVDSTFLLRTAKDVLEDHVVAGTAFSETLSPSELDDAKAFTRAFGIEHVILKSTEFDNPDFIKNDKNRCYHCKKEKFGLLMAYAAKNRIPVAMDGSNLDDRTDYRPGTKAATELGIRSPLVDAGMTKEDIRFLSKEMGLSTWNKPANACLATRIPYSHPITRDKLDAIDRGERFLKNLGFRPCLRVRHHDTIARLEIDPGDMAFFSDDAFRQNMILYFKKLGFTYITLDIEGFQTGSMNKTL
ncbi:MAG: ATP-dependent sacrificial sulfur transferase LarE [Proteobacteria bacterium]|nr:ATP-dependent sacrificial sulfur transferase LarE [Pseudomonadota bacterium]